MLLHSPKHFPDLSAFTLTHCPTSPVQPAAFSGWDMHTIPPGPENLPPLWSALPCQLADVLGNIHDNTQDIGCQPTLGYIHDHAEQGGW